MNRKPNSMQSDVESLLKDSVMAEAAGQVWLKFQSAMESLDEESAQLLQEYFSGQSVEKIAESRGVAPKELEQWLTATKRKLMAALRNTNPVRQ